MRGSVPSDFTDGERVIADNAHIRLDSRRLLEQVIEKNRNCRSGEIIIRLPSEARSMAFTTAFALFALSIYSLCGFGIRDDAAAGLHVTVPFFLARPCGWRCEDIHIAGEIQIAECAAVHAARLALPASSMISHARILGAPDSVPAGAPLRWHRRRRTFRQCRPRPESRCA